MARVRVKAGAARRCSRCRRRCPGYDTSPAPRRWRGLDLGTTQVYLQATTSRVSCREHGVVVAAVPWARPGVAVHHRVRGHRRVAGLPRHPVGGRDAAAGGLAQRGRHHHPGGRRPGREDRPAGRAAPDRDRRDQLPQGPALPALRGRPRHRPAGVGRQRTATPADLARLLRPARRTALPPSSPTSPPTAPSGSTTSSPSGPRRRCCAWTRSMSWPH